MLYKTCSVYFDLRNRLVKFDPVIIVHPVYILYEENKIHSYNYIYKYIYCYVKNTFLNLLVQIFMSK